MEEPMEIENPKEYKVIIPVQYWNDEVTPNRFYSATLVQANTTFPPNPDDTGNFAGMEDNGSIPSGIWVETVLPKTPMNQRIPFTGFYGPHAKEIAYAMGRMFAVSNVFLLAIFEGRIYGEDIGYNVVAGHRLILDRQLD